MRRKKRHESRGQLRLDFFARPEKTIQLSRLAVSLGLHTVQAAPRLPIRGGVWTDDADLETDYTRGIRESGLEFDVPEEVEP